MKNLIVDINLFLLRWHFAACFAFYYWLLETFKPAAIVGKYTWGFVFLLHDWLVEHFIMPLRYDHSLSKSDLVTTRLHRYKALLPSGSSIESLTAKDREKYLWAIEECDFLNQFDIRPEGHC